MLSEVQWHDAWRESYRYCARIEEQAIQAIAAVWSYLDEKWEVAAVRTRPELRNRGFAQVVTTFTTASILANGRIATSTTAEENIPMRHVLARRVLP